MTRCLCRPMSIVLNMCTWSFVLCNGKRTARFFLYFLEQSVGWRRVKHMLHWSCPFLPICSFFEWSTLHRHLFSPRSVLARSNCTVPVWLRLFLTSLNTYPPTHSRSHPPHVFLSVITTTALIQNPLKLVFRPHSWAETWMIIHEYCYILNYWCWV